MPNPAGVKKRGVYSAFNPRNPPGLNYATQGKIFKRQKKAVYRVLKRRERETDARMDLFFYFRSLERSLVLIDRLDLIGAARLDSKKTDRILATARNAMAVVEDYAEDISQKKIGEIKVAMISKERDIYSQVSEAKLKTLEKFYRDFVVWELGENYVEDPGKFQKLMKGGVVDIDFFGEDYIIPAVILNRFKTYRGGYLYNLLESKEKRFMDDAFKWFLARTPSSVYELREGAPLPSWYLKDLYQAMDEYASKLAR